MLASTLTPALLIAATLVLLAAVWLRLRFLRRIGLGWRAFPLRQPDPGLWFELELTAMGYRLLVFVTAMAILLIDPLLKGRVAAPLLAGGGRALAWITVPALLLLAGTRHRSDNFWCLLLPTAVLVAISVASAPTRLSAAILVLALALLGAWTEARRLTEPVERTRSAGDRG